MDEIEKNTEVNADTSSVNEKLEKIAKESKKIAYSTEIMDSDYKISFHELRDSAKKEDKGVFILKYNIKGIPQEVIIGTMKRCKGQIRNAKIIIELIEGQLKENFQGQTEYAKFAQLKTYLERNQIDFAFTMEGTEIYLDTEKNMKIINRTYAQKKHKFNKDSYECLYTDDEMKVMRVKRKEQTQKLVEKIEKNEKWKRRRELILKKLPSEEEKRQFLEGEKISEIFQENDESIVANRRYIVADYLLEKYNNPYYRTIDSISMMDKYLAIKESGITADAEKIIEKVQKGYSEKIRENEEGKIEVLPEDRKILQILDKYKSFFQLLRTGRDFNARAFASKWNKINYGVLYKFFEKYAENDEELLEYLKLKEAVLKDVKVKEKETVKEYMTYDSVKNLSDFILHSSVRENTKESDEKCILEIYNINDKIK